MSKNNYVTTHEGLSLKDILAELEGTNDESEILIYVTPPDDQGETDADSDKSDEEHEGNLNHLGRNLLHSKCEVQTACIDEDQVPVNSSPNVNSSPSVNSLPNVNSSPSVNSSPNVNSSPSVNSVLHASTGQPSAASSSGKRPRKNSLPNKYYDSESEFDPAKTKMRKICKTNKQTNKPLTKKQTKENSKQKKIDQWNTNKPNFKINTSCDPKPCSDEAMECKSPLDFFSLYFDDEMLELICEQSNLYALQKNVSLYLTKEELLVFLGGLLMSGYAKYPNKRMYWSRENDVPTLLSESMRCNRFEQILRFLHLNDNNNINSDRLYKLRPFIDRLNLAFALHGGLDENLSIDESMIPYYGKHYAKQYIRGKPIRFGFKNWALCSSNGYLISFDIYTGKANSRESYFGVGGDVVVSLLEKAEVPNNCGHKIFIDNYFTSVALLKHLANIGMCATGTLRADRTEYCPLKSNKELQSEVRGAYDFRSTDNVMVVRWHDNSVVTAATNYESLNVGTATRWSREKKLKVQVQQPTVYASYNKGMGGVDLLDQNIAAYRTRMRQRKWWWPIFVYLFDASVVNSWILNRKLLPPDESINQLLKFRRNLALTILKQFGKPSSQGRFPPKPLLDIRQDKRDHWPLEIEKQRRCAYCPGKAKFICSKCNVGLHPRCFMGYHSS